ncbi:MAG: type II toxin-antitoxin system Phd/YefM family antitoxin [Opitutaceae bacterium]
MKVQQVAIGAFEAKNKFSELLERARRGVSFTITKHDQAVARLVPPPASSRADRKKATLELRELRQRYSLKGISARELLDEGRR